MKFLSRCLILFVFAGSLSFDVHTATTTTAQGAEPSNSSSSDEPQKRGRYLVMHVAQCIQCHTPRDRRGELLMDQLMQGAPIPISGPANAPTWALESPWVAGLANYQADFVLHLLQHGERPDGTRPKSPMPQFRMTEEDAKAVVAFLKSL